MFVKCCALLLLIAGLQLCWAAPAVETQGVEVSDNKLVAYSAIPAVPLLSMFHLHIHKPHLSHLIPHKISGTIHKGPVTVHGSVSIGHHK
ncbi:Hypothetical protein NTJ_13513 [Nesidiocoris tenuis]|uniref:Uncharacterized protein n=1 Tax=Nesidiocoris tenuis TaxID=355587 RepID=A0ABN7BC22_9HEMI|nr:Hypothetical protein NTJ_13513 [Nesidiocoris tenuis]